MQFNGQWLGQYSGSNTGTIFIDIDDMGDHYSGYAHLYDDEPLYANSFVQLTAPKNTSKFSLPFIKIVPLDRFTGIPSDWQKVRTQYKEDLVFPQTAEVSFDIRDDNLFIEWKTNIGTHGSATLPKSQAGQFSEYKPDLSIQTWEAFKAFVNELEPRRFVFRGQDGPWRLRTSFHRTRRADLAKFFNEDIPALHRNLSARTKHIFNLNNPDENGAFINLVRHHGYPTPLLDWTYSPYVGAFFAYRYCKPETGKVRIFMFNQKHWCSDYSQIKTLAHTLPHFSILDFIPINNERMIPQQAISSITNVDDIETYIKAREHEAGKEYLRVIELSATERSKVMRELSVMGITAGSLFPGLDGACEELKERFFNKEGLISAEP